MIAFFNYAKRTIESESPVSATGFFDLVAGKTGAFLDHNNRHIKWVSGLSKEDFRDFQYDLGDMSKNITMTNNDANTHSLAMLDFIELQMYGSSKT